MFNSDEVEEFYFDAIHPRLGEAERADVDDLLKRLRTSTRKQANKHLHPWILLIDEAIQFLIHLDRLIGTRDKMGTTLFNLLTLVTKLKSLSISFRELILLGQADSSRLILRGFIETSNMTLVALADPVFCTNYAPDTTEHNDKKFYDNKLAHGKLGPFVKEALNDAGFDDDEIDDIIQFKRNWKNELSGAVHNASWSTFQTCLIPSLPNPGMLVGHSLGHLSAHSPPLCNVLIQEVRCLSTKLSCSLVMRL